MRIDYMHQAQALMLTLNTERLAYAILILHKRHFLPPLLSPSLYFQNSKNIGEVADAEAVVGSGDVPSR